MNIFPIPPFFHHHNRKMSKWSILLGETANPSPETRGGLAVSPPPTRHRFRFPTVRAID